MKIKMEKIKIVELVLKNTFTNIKIQPLIETFLATIIAVVVPTLLAHTPNNQFIVGPIVNAVLFWVVWRVGVINAIFIAVVPSIIALFRGMLPPQAAVMIPFIIAGNCAMIITFSYFVGTWHCHVPSRNRTASCSEQSSALFLRVIFASLAKTLVIFLPAWLFLNLPPTVNFMMSWPQLVTAVFGGFSVVMINKSLST